MKGKLQIAILAVGLFSILIPASSGDVGFLDYSGQKAREILNIDKLMHCDFLKSVFSGDVKKHAEMVLHAPVAYVEKSTLGDCYRNQPFLFGFLTLFTVISLGALGFIFHLIRNDSRFY